MTETVKELEAGRELDAEIAERIFGWSGRTLVRKGKADEWQIAFRDAPANTRFDYARWFTEDGTKVYCGKPWTPHFAPPYSTSIAAAWPILGHISGDYHVSILGGGTINVVYIEDFNERLVTAPAATAPLAICRAAIAVAALRALGQ